VFRLDALNRNLCNEIKKGKKIYFYDNGIRNAVYEFKLSHKKKSRFSKSFTDAYQPAETRTISPENLEEFLLMD